MGVSMDERFVDINPLIEDGWVLLKKDKEGHAIQSMRLTDLPVADVMPVRARYGDVVWAIGTKCMAESYEDMWICDSEKCDTFTYDKEYTVFDVEVTFSMFAYIHELGHIRRFDKGYFVWGKNVFKTKEEAFEKGTYLD